MDWRRYTVTKGKLDNTLYHRSHYVVRAGLPETYQQKKSPFKTRGLARSYCMSPAPQSSQPAHREHGDGTRQQPVNDTLLAGNRWIKATTDPVIKFPQPGNLTLQKSELGRQEVGGERDGNVNGHQVIGREDGRFIGGEDDRQICKVWSRILCRVIINYNVFMSHDMVAMWNGRSPLTNLQWN